MTTPPTRLVRLTFTLAVALLTTPLFAPAFGQSPGDTGAAGDVPEALAQCLDAHGGLDTWSQYGTLEYAFTRERGGTTLQDRQLVDLVDRRLRITADAYTIVHDGQTVGIAPGPDALDYGPGPRFYSMTYFYFFAIPFVLADPGTNHEAMGTETVDGTPYDVVKVSYDAGVGDAPEDVYLAYIDAETHRLGFVRYSVTYGDIGRTEPTSVIHYREWTETSGLVVPTRATFHPWEDGSLGASTAEVRFDAVAFASERPSDDAFAMPEGAATIPPPGE